MWTLQVQWRALDEINAGACDGMTYVEIKKNMPEEYEYVIPSFYIMHCYIYFWTIPHIRVNIVAHKHLNITSNANITVIFKFQLPALSRLYFPVFVSCKVTIVTFENVPEDVRNHTD